jgi:hypothetical protein
MKKFSTLARLIVMPAMLYAGLTRSADTDPTFAALIMELSGVTTPPLVVHREVAAGTKIAIKPGAHLALLHYATCDIVSFSGGTVTVTTQGLQVAGANVQGTMPGPCPRAHRISLNSPRPQGGGTVSRFGGGPRQVEAALVPPDGLVVITGAEAANALSADVLDADRKVVDGDDPHSRRYVPVKRCSAAAGDPT